jgi:hypothetical protein
LLLGEPGRLGMLARFAACLPWLPACWSVSTALL